jgi:hypothetical protein
MNVGCKSLAFGGALVLVAFILAEGVLQLSALVSSRARLILSSPWDPAAAPVVPDERLEFRPNPALPDHDANGFRNPVVPRRAEIVALGDSQTYGTGVGAADAWPRVLERLLGRSTYSMAAGGYGPVHSLILLEQARRLEPALIIEALYAGNDLYDAYRLVYLKGQLPNLWSAQARRSVSEAEQNDPIEPRVNRMSAACGLRVDKDDAGSPASGLLQPWLASHSRIYGLARRLKYEVRTAMDRRYARDDWDTALAAATGSEYCRPFSAGNSRTVLTPDYRFAALDLEDPRIHEGERIAFQAIREMQDMASRDRIRLLVLLLPTKELVFSKLGATAISRSAGELDIRERRFWADAKAFLSSNSIEFVDALEPLQVQLERGPQPYHVSSDGHPNETGHRVIAEAIATYLKEHPR